MKRSSYATFVRSLALCAGLWTGVAFAGKEAVPVLQCEDPVFDFGTHPQGQGFVSHTFNVGNTGGAPLHIRRVAPLEGCTCRSLAIAGLREVPTGGKTGIEVRMSSDKALGPVSEIWVVETNDPEHPNFQIELKGSFVRNFEVEPSSMQFGTIGKDSKTTQVVEITSNRGSFGFLEVGALNHFTVSVERISDQHYRISATTRPPLVGGQIHETLRLKTDNAKLGDLEIPVSASVPSPMLLVPESFVYNLDSQELPSVAICSNNQMPFKVLNVSGPDKKTRIKLEALSGHAYLLNVVHLRPALSLDGANVRITTDHPDAKEILIPVKIR